MAVGGTVILGYGAGGGGAGGLVASSQGSFLSRTATAFSVTVCNGGIGGSYDILSSNYTPPLWRE